jgi:hypothetical protein
MVLSFPKSRRKSRGTPERIGFGTIEPHHKGTKDTKTDTRQEIRKPICLRTTGTLPLLVSVFMPYVPL